MNTPARPTKPTVSFHAQVMIAKTFHADDYNRTAITVTPMQRADVYEFNAYRRALRHSIAVQQQMFRWTNDTDKFMADVLGGSLFSSSVLEPSSDSEYSDSSSRVSF